MERKALKSKICFIINENYNKNIELNSFRGRHVKSFSKFISNLINIKNKDIFDKIKHLFPETPTNVYVYNDNEICKFRNEYAFLSNFYKANFIYKNIIFSTAEHAYQWEKANKNDDKEKILNCIHPKNAKQIGRKVEMIKDWDKLKLNFMYDILQCKFENTELKQKLIDTNNKELIEGNWWHDCFWGVCQCINCKNKPGLNHLGKSLMKIRENIK